MSSIIRNALVTGATSGIGQAIAETLAARGVHVIVSGRDAARGDVVVKKIRARGGDALFQAADLATAAAASDLAKASEKLVGSVDILSTTPASFRLGQLPRPARRPSMRCSPAMYAALSFLRLGWHQ